MSQLTTFSKALIIIAALGIFSLFAITCYNCTKSEQYRQPATTYQTPSPVQDYGTHQVITQPGGTQVVVVKDQQTGAEFFMEYMMFQSLMNTVGGMNNVYGYYNQHRYDPTWDRDQGYYRSNSKTVINNYYGTSIDDSKPITEQVKQKEIEYQKSNGFSKPTTPTNTGTKSSGFTEKWFSPSTTTSTPEPKYEKSSGFKSTSGTSTYQPSSGFKSSGSTSTYTPSSGFKSSGSTSTYKPSSGFKSSSSSSSGSSYKSSSGFKKKN